jgi:hypothetical protein
MRNIDELIKDLPQELHQEVEDFVEFLLTKRMKKTAGNQLSNGGALKDLRDRYNSVELQHKISEFRIKGR